MKLAPVYVLYHKPEFADDLMPHSVHDTPESAKREAVLQDDAVARAADWNHHNVAVYGDGWSDPEPYGGPRMGQNIGRKLQFIVDSDADCDSEEFHSYEWRGWEIQAHNWGDKFDW